MTTFKLQTEIALYEANLAKLVAEHRGEFVLIKGNKIVGYFPTEREALDSGYDSFGNEPFLVRPCVDVRTPVMFISL